ncbi:hypothetical protein EV193_106116 [Herbihabitans rhizosphaerae]|uniref:Uncharacterized protein n=1 Tax=Herbihabitans rhizosphaerae TaxID=1872711 RepID=A0A4Q7KNS7_9PSEU|nr:hypothetical protein [Herbihabitans rhizosphaerae]RZS36882.1 hypothetical protein EV193_106116 [Herbihabitans rhizosphaerae]
MTTIDVPDELAAAQHKYGGEAGRAWIAALPDLAPPVLDAWELRAVSSSPELGCVPSPKVRLLGTTSPALCTGESRALHPRVPRPAPASPAPCTRESRAVHAPCTPIAPVRGRGSPVIRVRAGPVRSAA